VTCTRTGPRRRKSILERLRGQLYDVSELYRYWAGNLPHHPTRVQIDKEHKVIFDAALARDADPVVDLLTNTSRRRRVTSRPSHPKKMPNRRRSTRLPVDGPGPGGAAPGR
jgi:hypothetical protein